MRTYGEGEKQEREKGKCPGDKNLSVGHLQVD